MMVSRSGGGAVGGASVTRPMWMPRMSTSLRNILPSTQCHNLIWTPVKLDQRVPAAEDGGAIQHLGEAGDHTPVNTWSHVIIIIKV